MAQTKNRAYNEVLHRLTGLPRKMLTVHGRDDMAAFVMHELGHDHCFNLDKAAYVVENPDFDCLKGIVGFKRDESYDATKDIWGAPEEFTDHMNGTSFNKQVRGVEKPSMRRKGASDRAIIDSLAQQLQFTDPAYYAWNMKHGNRGFLIYKKNDPTPCDCPYLLDSLALLSFCPYY